MINLKLMKDEMLIHTPICTHPSPKNILILGGCSKMPSEIEKYREEMKLKQIKVDSNIINNIQNLDDKFFDIVIVGNREYLKNEIFFGVINSKLKDDGVLSTFAFNMYTEEDDLESQLSIMGKYFNILMPYSYHSLKEDLITHNNLILASHKYHPISDINLQRADLTDGLYFYNSDLAIASFAIPTILKKRYLGYIKN